MGSGPEKFSPRNPFGSDLRHFGENNSSRPLNFNPYNLNPGRHLPGPINPNVLPHPFIAHFYPVLGAQRELCRNLNTQNPQNPVSAIAALAASASGPHFSNEVLNEFQNGNFRRELLNLEFNNQQRNFNQLKNSQQQFDGETSFPDFQHFSMMAQSEKQSEGFGLGGSSIHPAWSEILRRIGTQNSAENSPSDETPSDILFQNKSANFLRQNTPEQLEVTEPGKSRKQHEPVTTQMEYDITDNKGDDVDKQSHVENSFSFKTLSRARQDSNQDDVSIDPGTFKRRYSSSSSTHSKEDFPRTRRRKRTGDVRETCPVCGVTVRPSELSSHLSQEMDKFFQLPNDFRKKLTSNRRPILSEKQSSTSYFSSTSTSVTSSLRRLSEKDLLMREDHDNRLKTFLKVRSNRVGRLNTRVGQCFRAQRTISGKTNNFSANLFQPGNPWKNNSLPPIVDDSCPCCFAELGDLSVGEVGAHIEQCFSKRTFRRDPSDVTEDDDDVMVDVESPVDLSAIITPRGDVTSCSGDVTNKMHVRRASSPNVDQNLDVESDDSRSFGPSQFDESNIEAHKLNNYGNETRNEGKSKSPTKSNLSSHVIGDVTSLQLKVDKLENEKRSFRCMICMDCYHNPVTSIQCWHVYCEQCWLRALAVKKLCPKCKAITPVDKLRRIYL